MKELESWLDDMGNRPLPGGVAAAAVAGAMGAALVSKAIVVSLKRQPTTAAEQATLRAVLDVVRARQAALLELADADVEAYRAVLHAERLPETDPEREKARRVAFQVPIDVAETCASILRRLPEVIPSCWTGVCVDFQIGSSLLAAGIQAGLLATEANASAWGGAEKLQALRDRLASLSQVEPCGEPGDADERGD